MLRCNPALIFLLKFLSNFEMIKTSLKFKILLILMFFIPNLTNKNC